MTSNEDRTKQGTRGFIPTPSLRQASIFWLGYMLGGLGCGDMGLQPDPPLPVGPRVSFLGVAQSLMALISGVCAVVLSAQRFVPFFNW
jgi:hypothetical protein